MRSNMDEKGHWVPPAFVWRKIGEVMNINSVHVGYIGWRVMSGLCVIKLSPCDH